jgi:hypothetical protein
MWHQLFGWLNYQCFGRACYLLLQESSCTRLQDYAILHLRSPQCLFTSVCCVDRSVQIRMYLSEFQQLFKYVLLGPRALYKTYRLIQRKYIRYACDQTWLWHTCSRLASRLAQQTNSTFRLKVFYCINCAIQNSDWVSKRVFLLESLSYGSNMPVLHASFVSFQTRGLHPTL